jgi:hypothetical protein
MRRLCYRFLALSVLLAIEGLAWGHYAHTGASEAVIEDFTPELTILVSISQASARVREGSTQVFDAKVHNDPKHLGVERGIRSPCDFGPACRGAFVRISPFSATYKAPLTTAGNPIRIVADKQCRSDQICRGRCDNCAMTAEMPRTRRS